MRTSTVMAGALVLGLAGGAAGQGGRTSDVCLALASVGLYDEGRVEVDQTHWSRVARFYQTNQSQSDITQVSGGLDVVIPIGDIIPKIGAWGAGNFEDEVRRSEVDYSSSIHFNRFRRSATYREVNGSVVERLGDCIRRNGVHAKLIRDDPGVVEIRVFYVPQPSTPSTRVTLRPENGLACVPDNFTLSYAERGSPSKLVRCTRPHPDSASRSVFIEARGVDVVIDHLVIPPHRARLAFTGCEPQGPSTATLDTARVHVFCAGRYALRAPLTRVLANNIVDCAVELINLGTYQSVQGHAIYYPSGNSSPYRPRGELGMRALLTVQLARSSGDDRCDVEYTIEPLR